MSNDDYLNTACALTFLVGSGLLILSLVILLFNKTTGLGLFLSGILMMGMSVIFATSEA
jgi:hypothetical protein